MTCSYQIRNIDDIKIQGFDYLTLLYYKPSGVTHMVAPPIPQIIEIIGRDSLSANQIERKLSKDYDMQLDEDQKEDASFEQIIKARLNELIDLGLVVKVE